MVVPGLGVTWADAPLTDEDTQAVAVAGFVYRF